MDTRASGFSPTYSAQITEPVAGGMTVAALRTALETFPDDTRVTALYDAGCAQGDVVAVSIYLGDLVLEID